MSSFRNSSGKASEIQWRARVVGWGRGITFKKNSKRTNILYHRHRTKSRYNKIVFLKTSAMTLLTNQSLERILQDIQEERINAFFEKKRRERMRPNLSERDRVKQNIVESTLESLRASLSPLHPFSKID